MIYDIKLARNKWGKSKDIERSGKEGIKWMTNLRNIY
jgi:hypothetical protein